jgi:signal transduction histidine kinase
MTRRTKSNLSFTFEWLKKAPGKTGRFFLTALARVACPGGINAALSTCLLQPKDAEGRLSRRYFPGSMDAHTTTDTTDHKKVSPATLLTTILTVFAAAAAVVVFSRYMHSIVGIWMANSVLLAVFMKHRRRDWAWIAIAGFMAIGTANLICYPFQLSAIFAALNLLEVLLIAIPLRHLDLDRDFGRPIVLLAFYALAMLSPLAVAVLFAEYRNLTHGSPFITTAINWFTPDALGFVIFLPPMLTVKWSAIAAMFRGEKLFGTLALLGILAAAILFNFLGRSYPFAFLFFPIVLLMTFQRGFAGGTLGLLLSGLYMLGPALIGEAAGALHGHPVREQVVVVEIFIAVMGFSNILVGAALEERSRLEQWLASAITRAENSREEAIVARESAEKANRTKSMFLATMSHELRTPLNAVIGFAEMMNSEMFGPLGDKHYREYTGIIQGAGRHLLDLINDILDMSKIEAGKHEILRERLNVSDIVRDGLTLMAENASSGGVRLTSDLPLLALMIDADRRAMKQILLNLLSNAIKFTPTGGVVTAKAELRDEHVVLSVRDTGVGIPQDQIYRLGNPFVQIRNNAGTSQNGTGLGLALVRSLAEMQNGTLKIESEEGHGTLVSVSFPAGDAVSLAA